MSRLVTGLFLAAGMLLLAYSCRDDLIPQVRHIMAGESRLLVSEAPPVARIPHIFDLGIVDADGDGRLDLYSSNHNYRQVLLLDSGRGTYHDVLTEWGLDQNFDFPGWEQSFVVPVMNKRGLYIYWHGEILTLRTQGLNELGPASGTVRMFSEVSVKNNSGFAISQDSASVMDSPITETIIEFEVPGDGILELVPLSRGVPTRIELAAGFPLSSVFIGNQLATPTGHSFSPFLRDRHGQAWADINDDGELDVYISRGGVGGTLRKLPAGVREGITDELLVTGGVPRFRDVTVEAGIEKKDCSGRHVEWVDINGDGQLELFVNCQDRGKSSGTFPKQLWQQGTDGKFRDVAKDAGLDLLGREVIDFIWMDVDNDGDIDLLTTEDKGIFLYSNKAARYTAMLVVRPDFVRADVPGLRNMVNNYWRFDGKMVAADFDSNGYLDVFVASKRGNVLLLNDQGRFRQVTPADIGLPARSISSVWVDYDNDGLVDLHDIPDGLYRQTPGMRFQATGLLAMTPHLYQAAIVHWYDRDNDGRRDVLLALNENPSLWRWWQRPFRNDDDIHNWTLKGWRNMNGDNNHWLQIDVSGFPGNTQAIGARVTVSTPYGTQVQEVGVNDSSFFSQGHYRLYFGLGSASRLDRITVRWSNGQTREFSNVVADQLLRIGPAHSID